VSNKDSDEIAVRPAEAGDFEAFAGILRWSVEEGWANFQTVPSPASELREMWEMWESRRGLFPYFVGEVGGEVVGAAWSSPWKNKPGYAWTAEVSVYVLPAGQGRGLARGLYERLFATLKAQGYRLLIAGVALPNEPSVRLHESFGMVKAAHFEKNGFKMGAWRDVGYWTLHYEGDDPPAPVRDVSDALGTTGG